MRRVWVLAGLFVRSFLAVPKVDFGGLVTEMQCMVINVEVFSEVHRLYLK